MVTVPRCPQGPRNAQSCRTPSRHTRRVGAARTENTARLPLPSSPARWWLPKATRILKRCTPRPPAAAPATDKERVWAGTLPINTPRGRCGRSHGAGPAPWAGGRRWHRGQNGTGWQLASHQRRGGQHVRGGYPPRNQATATGAYAISPPSANPHVPSATRQNGTTAGNQRNGRKPSGEGPCTHGCSADGATRARGQVWGYGERVEWAILCPNVSARILPGRALGTRVGGLYACLCMAQYVYAPARMRL